MTQHILSRPILAVSFFKVFGIAFHRKIGLTGGAVTNIIYLLCSELLRDFAVIVAYSYFGAMPLELDIKQKQHSSKGLSFCFDNFSLCKKKKKKEYLSTNTFLH